MTTNTTGGSVLTVASIDEVAKRITEMWATYNNERTVALALSEEVKRYVYATDVETTSAEVQPFKNRTHQPKLAQIYDRLLAQLWQATLGQAEFFEFEGNSPADKAKAKAITAWVRTKLEQKKFRQTIGKDLLMDYVQTGNCFANVDYIVERDSNSIVTYKGIEVVRLNPLDFVFNSRAKSFSKAAKMHREFIHVSELAMLPTKFPAGGFDVVKIKEAVATRQTTVADDWADLLKEQSIVSDGLGSWKDYFRQDYVEVIIYRGDVFNPDTLETQANRIVYVVDRVHVIRNEPNKAPVGFDGTHQAVWRLRPDSLWGQGALDNIVGLQYRIDHLENLKADAFDLVVNPPLVIQGEEITEPEEGYAPRAVYYVPSDGKIGFLVPDTNVLNVNNEIATYHKLMEDFAGVPSNEALGYRSKGEKTAFEVDTLVSNQSISFIERAKNFELMLENMLKEMFNLMLINYDGADYVMITNDITGQEELAKLSQEDVRATGRFIAIGSRKYDERNRKVQQYQQYLTNVGQIPSVSAHISGLKIAEAFSQLLEFDEGTYEPFIGIKEQVEIQVVAQQYQQQIGGQSQQAQGQPTDNPNAVQSGQGTPPDNTTGSTF